MRRSGLAAAFPERGRPGEVVDAAQDPQGHPDAHVDAGELHRRGEDEGQQGVEGQQLSEGEPAVHHLEAPRPQQHEKAAGVHQALDRGQRQGPDIAGQARVELLSQPPRDPPHLAALGAEGLDDGDVLQRLDAHRLGLPPALLDRGVEVVDPAAQEHAGRGEDGHEGQQDRGQPGAQGHHQGGARGEHEGRVHGLDPGAGHEGPELPHVVAGPGGQIAGAGLAEPARGPRQQPPGEGDLHVEEHAPGEDGEQVSLQQAQERAQDGDGQHPGADGVEGVPGARGEDLVHEVDRHQGQGHGEGRGHDHGGEGLGGAKPVGPEEAPEEGEQGRPRRLPAAGREPGEPAHSHESPRPVPSGATRSM